MKLLESLPFLRLGGATPSKRKGARGKKKAPQKLNPLLIYLLVGTLVFFVYTRTVIPLQEEVASLEGELRALDVGHVVQVEARLREVQRDLMAEKEKLKSVLAEAPPGPEETQSLIYETARLVGLSNLVVEGMETHRSPTPLLGGFEVSYNFRGTFDQVLAFLGALEKRGFRNKEMRIAPYAEGGKRYLLVQGRFLVLSLLEEAQAQSGR